MVRFFRDLVFYASYVFEDFVKKVGDRTLHSDSIEFEL